MYVWKYTREERRLSKLAAVLSELAYSHDKETFKQSLGQRAQQDLNAAFTVRQFRGYAEAEEDTHMLKCQWATTITEVGDKKIGFLCFRGTEHRLDWITNFLAMPHQLDGESCQQGIHFGFLSVVQRELDDLTAALLELSELGASRIILCGHSMGGALALCLLFFTQKKIQIDCRIEAITFGAPAVFHGTVPDCGGLALNFVHNLDIVPRVTGSTNTAITRKVLSMINLPENSLSEYKHVGRFVWLIDDTAYLLTPEEVVSELDISRSLPALPNIMWHHSMQQYVQCVTSLPPEAVHKAPSMGRIANSLLGTALHSFSKPTASSETQNLKRERSASSHSASEEPASASASSQERGSSAAEAPSPSIASSLFSFAVRSFMSNEPNSASASVRPSKSQRDL